MFALQKVCDSSIGSAAALDSPSLSSQSNFAGSSSSDNTSTPLNSSTTSQQLAIGINSDAVNSSSGSGHKNSLKGTKLARRARSFKDDLIEKISLMRTPTHTLTRSHSPQSPRNKNSNIKPEDMARTTLSLETHVKDICNALKHFRDVILKRKFEVLPGNGTVILETIASMFALIQSYALNENSAILLSATQQVNQCLGNLLKLCDEVMLNDESDESASLSNENVKEIVDLLEEAVKNLVMQTHQKIKEKNESGYKNDSGAPDAISHGHGHLMRPAVEVAGQRTSLPDITLTPKERDILEKTNSNPIRASHSTESILRETSPPPKPPLPNRSSNPPPLPPKRRIHHQSQNSNNVSLNSDLDCSSDFSLINCSVDHLSVNSRSPDENSSQCSLDSAFNHSREEEEQKYVTLETIEALENSLIQEHPDQFFAINSIIGKGSKNLKSFEPKANNGCVSGGGGGGCVGDGTMNSAADKIDNCVSHAEMSEMIKNTNRCSQESGFASMNSMRASETFRKRFSEYSFQSSAKSSNSEIAFKDSSEFQNNEIHFHQAEQTSKNTFYSRIGNFGAVQAEEEHRVYKRLGWEKSDDSPWQLGCETSNNTSPECYQSDKCMTTATSANINVVGDKDDVIPPALPPKMGRKLAQFEHFDEVDDAKSTETLEAPELRQHHHHHLVMWQSKHQSLMEPPRGQLTIAGSCNAIDNNKNVEEPPPLPMKKKHILAYMEICSASSRSAEQHRHTMHAYSTRNISHSQTMNVFPPFTKDPSIEKEEIAPPILPPKSYRPRMNMPIPPTIITTPPPSPKPSSNPGDESNRHVRILLNTNHAGNELMTTVCEEQPDLADDEDDDGDDQTDKRLAHKTADSGASDEYNSLNEMRISPFKGRHEKASSPSSDLSSEGKSQSHENCSLSDAKLTENVNVLNLLEEINITSHLILKKEGEDGPEVKGGYIDALIVHASKVQKVSDNAFSEAFITTFRTFIRPIDLVEKLTHRYTVFFCQMNDQKQKAAKETFSLLVRVVNDLTSTDLTNQLFLVLVEFVYQLICSGQLYQAKLLRNKLVEKATIYKEQKFPTYTPEMSITTVNLPGLLELKSVEIAEQMTLLDAELFQKIEIPEVLLFAKEQCEEKSPNLNKFTEHFNKMSYWARSKILTLNDAKEREKHVIKFIKIMKHLRKMNNYNSYLALLSALDSAPVRRLEWHKTITEGLKEYCTLIDSSSSFRVYRQALAETSPPCIPYIGLVLQDLTFVHVGNPDYLREDVINFSKRWQQYNIIVNMKRFMKCAYPFKRNERIIRFFENFEKFLGEEQMWQISESIKPRGKRSMNYNN